jgi:hypothetical protein
VGAFALRLPPRLDCCCSFGWAEGDANAGSFSLQLALGRCADEQDLSLGARHMQATGSFSVVLPSTGQFQNPCIHPLRYVATTFVYLGP